jgi:hypothetical protein
VNISIPVITSFGCIFLLVKTSISMQGRPLIKTVLSFWI